MTIAAFAFVVNTSTGQSLNVSGGYSSSTITFNGGNESYTETYNGTTYTYSEKVKNRSGFNVSLAYEFRLGNRLSLETGLKYQTRGFRMESEYSIISESYDSKESSTFKFKSNYLDLPIVLNTAILTGDVRVYARTGIYAGFFTGGKYSEKGVYESSDGDNGIYEYTGKMDDFDREERITAGVLVGVGAEYKGLFVETNFSIGPMMVTEMDSEMFTKDLSFTIGYKLKFKK